LNETAKAFGIEKWPVVAVKAFLGHSIGVSAGDQMMATLGIWEEGIIPGIATIDHVAEDVHDSHLTISSEHKNIGRDGIDSAIINSKGFGGNNASATVIAPHIVRKMLDKKYGTGAMRKYHAANDTVSEVANAYDAQCLEGKGLPIYKFDHNVLDGNKIEFGADKIKVPGYDQDIDLAIKSPYADLI
jgi:acetoacetyl-[acyl-carrier protein] synthase